MKNGVSQRSVLSVTIFDWDRYSWRHKKSKDHLFAGNITILTYTGENLDILKKLLQNTKTIFKNDPINLIFFHRKKTQAIMFIRKSNLSQHFNNNYRKYIKFVDNIKILGFIFDKKN